MDAPGRAPAPTAAVAGPRPRAAPPLESILEAVGGTPVVRLGRVVPPGAAAIYAKLESFNPGGSVKDRIALAMVEAAARDGRLAPGGRIVEPTSGNTGVGLALVCAVKGYRLVLVIPDSTSLEHRQALEAYGGGDRAHPLRGRSPRRRRAGAGARAERGSAPPRPVREPREPRRAPPTAPAPSWWRPSGAPAPRSTRSSPGSGRAGRSRASPPSSGARAPASSSSRWSRRRARCSRGVPPGRPGSRGSGRGSSRPCSIGPRTIG